MHSKQFILDLENQDLAVYPSSVNSSDDSAFAIVRYGKTKLLAVRGPYAAAFEAVEEAGDIKLCALTVSNAQALMAVFPWTKPVARNGKRFSFGLGDRLGLATPGHIRAIQGVDVFPVFAQQSIRELNLTKRRFPEVIAAACFAVYQEGYRDGYGADGDHLKTIEEISYALDSGCTMITLDCSEHMDTEANSLGEADLALRYEAVPQTVREYYESLYLDADLPIVGRIQKDELMRIVSTFYKAIEHAKTCYAYMISLNDQVDFEMSIDETPGVTSPAEHFVVGSELTAAKVKVSSLAPHFFGAFEKGIDYVGDLDRLERELVAHQAIAEHYGYRLSLHSGSDKFSVFPLFGRITQLDAHTKTAGTNWLEAVRVLARYNPTLFRRMLAYSIEQRAEAERYYHVSTRLSDIIPLESRADDELVLYLDEDAARQTIHITYGLLLNEPWFRDPFFRFMDEHEEDFSQGIDSHISRHFVALGAK